MKKRLVVGVTGTFGSGKSTVSRIFKKLGAKKVIDCDRIAHEPFRIGHPLQSKLKVLFRKAAVVDGGKKLSRNGIAKEVFRDKKKLKRLEAVIHPYVRQRALSEIKRMKKGVVIVEVPLLFETGFDRLCDVVVAVAAGKHSVKHLRALGFTKAEIRARQQAQFSEARKKRFADFIIQNTGSKKTLEQKSKLLWKKFTSI